MLKQYFMFLGVRVFCPNYDLYFDRTISLWRDTGRLAANQGKTDHLTSVGILLDTDRILTTYNPYRGLSQLKENERTIEIRIILTRSYELRYKNDEQLYYYAVQKKAKIACARQVVAIRDSDIQIDQWHNRIRMLTPVHDLMGARMHETVVLMKNKPVFYDYTKTHHATEVGPLTSVLASANEKIEGRFMIGLINAGRGTPEWTRFKCCYICSEEYNADVIVDCDEWFPADWGHFICVSNVDGFTGVHSGALLVYNYKVFGIGSFFMSKGNESILVFTDVRPYYELIMNTCTVKDQI